MALIPGTLPTGTKYPNDPQSLLDTFASYLTSPEVKKNRPTVTEYGTVDGVTISVRPDGLDETIFLNHTTTATAATVAFPTNDNSVTGQIVRIFSRSAVTTLTVTTLGSLVIRGAALTSLSAGDAAVWQKVAADTWVRLQ